ncbi:hypothetical protein BDC45DRAFT_232545 [Circinella umbellata]|nr:hypothetical protein BDC45DRAFT_232545 [Circinella umbellata]
MLNPKANEFKPGQFGPPSTETPKPKPQLEEEKSLQQQQRQQQQLHSKKRPPKSNKPQQQHQQKQQKSQGKSDRRSTSDHHQPKKSNKSKNQQVTNGSGSGVGSGRRHKGGSSSTHPQQQQQQQPISSSSTPQQADNDNFGLLTKFITIEEAIDPVFRTRPTEDGSKNLEGGSGSTGEALGKLIHGYERYIEWISRCLRAFETITVVGMDYAIADVISLVTILQRRNIGEHEEVETFSLDQGNKRYTSGIQVKVHLCA